MASNNISEVLEYLVLKKMAGRPEFLRALLEYVDGLASPTTISSTYGLSKYQFRGFAQRIYDKAGNRSMANLLIKITVPLILEKTEVYIDRSQRPEICRVCGKKLYNVFPEDHIKKHHKDLIDYEKQKIISELKKILKQYTKESKEVIADTY
ncbi:MAG: hypothetical protein ACP5GI_05995 [Sulfolobales archaeon]